jgi:uncharacterized protein YqhQ
MRKLTIFLLLSCVVFLSLNIADLTNASDGSGKMSLESRKISCQTFIDLSKLIISLATGVFVVVPSFMSLIKKESIKSKKKLYFGLIFLCISIIFGLFTISALAGTQRMGEYNIASGLISARPEIGENEISGHLKIKPVVSSTQK